jgi:hypothetical protein
MMDLVAHRVLPDRLVLLVLLDQLEPLDRLVLPEVQEPLEPLGRLVPPDLLEHRELEDLRVLRGRQEPPVVQDLPDLPDLQDRQERQDLQELLAHQVNLCLVDLASFIRELISALQLMFLDRFHIHPLV